MKYFGNCSTDFLSTKASPFKFELKFIAVTPKIGALVMIVSDEGRPREMKNWRMWREESKLSPKKLNHVVHPHTRLITIFLCVRLKIWFGAERRRFYLGHVGVRLSWRATKEKVKFCVVENSRFHHDVNDEVNLMKGESSDEIAMTWLKIYWSWSAMHICLAPVEIYLTIARFHMPTNSTQVLTGGFYDEINPRNGLRLRRVRCTP